MLLSTCWQSGQRWISRRSFGPGTAASNSNLHLQTFWLAKGDVAQARPQAEAFSEDFVDDRRTRMASAGLGGECRVAMGEPDLMRAHDSIAKWISAMGGFEVPPAAWRVHATAFELYRNSGDRALAERHLALSRATIMKLANSMSAESHFDRTSCRRR